jgi:hypothetical protein
LIFRRRWVSSGGVVVEPELNSKVKAPHVKSKTPISMPQNARIPTIALVIQYRYINHLNPSNFALILTLAR